MIFVIILVVIALAGAGFFVMKQRGKTSHAIQAAGQPNQSEQPTVAPAPVPTAPIPPADAPVPNTPSPESTQPTQPQVDLSAAPEIEQPTTTPQPPTV